LGNAAVQDDFRNLSFRARSEKSFFFRKRRKIELNREAGNAKCPRPCPQPTSKLNLELNSSFADPA
jgi:hypothetical protein